MNLLVISSFPPKGQTHSKKVVGIASYTKNLLQNLPGRKIVLADILSEEKNYNEDSIEVRRVWRRNSTFAFFSLLKAVLREKNTPNVLFEFEHAMFGGPFSLIPLLFFLFTVNKLWGKKIFFVFHQVIGEIDSLSGHLNLKKQSLKSKLINLLVPLFYKMVLFNIDKAIVFEEELKQRLGDSEKVEVIPHGVESFDNKLSFEKAREELALPKDKFIILCFGFLAWYKGSDLIIDIFKRLPEKIKKNTVLVLAGGSNPNHIGKAHYDKYIANLNQQTVKNQVLVTGFVPQEKIEHYFQSCDVVFLPYRTFMSSSGPLSLALSFEKPFLISSNLKNLIKTQDFRQFLTESGLFEKDIVFKLNEEDLKDKLKALRKGNLKQNLVKFTKALRRERFFDKIAVNYERILFGDSDKTVSESYPILEPKLV